MNPRGSGSTSDSALSSSRPNETSTNGTSSNSTSRANTRLLVLGDSRLSAIDDRAVDVEYTLAESSVWWRLGRTRGTVHDPYSCSGSWSVSKSAETAVSVRLVLVRSDAGVMILAGLLNAKSCEVGVGASARSASALSAGLAALRLAGLCSGSFRAKKYSTSARGDAAGLRNVSEVASDWREGGNTLP